ncbi:MAG: GAF domain-containing protein [Burkholderiales bacterium]
MRIQFWGTRGSIAKPGPSTVRYGGNTSCVEVRSDAGTLIVMDCGTGGHPLGHQLMARRAKNAPVNGHMLISHTHWDHIQGIPFFAPMFLPGNTWNIYGPKGLSHSLRATLAGQMEHAYFPIALDQFASTNHYHDLVEGTFSIDDMQITTRYLNHPALTLGYRFECDGASAAYCCDHEPHSAAFASGELPITGVDRRYADFIEGADLVIHDSQYTALEYAARVGWGHSTVEYAVRVARDAGVKRLLLTHHDPLRDDASIDRIVAGIRERLRDEKVALDVEAAAEGMVVELRGSPHAKTNRDKHFKAETAISASSMARPVLLYALDQGMSQTLSNAVRGEGMPLAIAKDDTDLLRRTAQENYAVVMLEHNPPSRDGLALARAIREGEATGRVQVPIVLLTTGDYAASRENNVATDWLLAPFSLSYARTKIRAWALRSASRWIRAELPQDEAMRVSKLRELAILDTGPEERFDRITRIAAAAFGVPIALVSLVDSDRQWFKSNHGLSADETSRDSAFCAHVVAQNGELLVPDTLLDDRFADNPLVLEEPRVRFYAGAPLTLSNGSCIGTLCLLDTRRRELSHDDLRLLRDLRDLVLAEIERGAK